MTTAIRHVHAPKGPWSTKGGWEYNAVLIGATLAVVEEECGLAWALAAGAAGAAGSFALSKLAEQEATPAESASVPFQPAPPPETSVGQPTGGQTPETSRT
jgi:putative oxidoreductase